MAGVNARSDPSRGASNLTGRSNGEPISPEIRALLETDGRIFGRAEPLRSWRRPMLELSFLEKDDSDLPGDIEGGMPGRNMQRKLGTTRGSPRRSRTAKASRISRNVGEVAMCPRVGRMGLISGDGLGQNNPVWSESPWGGVEPHSKAVH